MKNIAIVFMVFLLAACSKRMPDSMKEQYDLHGKWKTETIKKGTHNHFGVLRAPSDDMTQSIFVMFDESIKYTLPDAAYQDAWNKMMPAMAEPDSWCHLRPQLDRMATFAYRWYEDKLQLGWYQHVECDSVPLKGWLADIEINTPYLLQLTTGNNKYTFRILDRDINLVGAAEIPRELHATNNVKYRLGITFGGIYPAPQDIRVHYKYFP